MPPEENLQNNTELTDEQVTDLYNKIQSPNTNIPDSAPAEPKSWEVAEGVNASEEQLVDYAKKGYEFNQNQESFNKEKQEYDGIVNKYKQIDEFAIQNPEWWDHVQNSYSNREANNDTIDQGNNLPAELSPELQSMQNQLNEVTQFISAQKQEQNKRQIAEEDSLLDAEVNDVREKYDYMDFGKADEKGLTLEQKVLNHAKEIGTGSFRVAFRDYAHDKLIAKAQEVGKENLGKVIEKQTKLGILGNKEKSAMPEFKGGNVKNKSYDDLLKEGLDELGIK